MSNKLADKVAIITGGGNGIGEAVSLVFAKEGAKVVVVDVDGLAAERVAEEIREGKGQAIAAKVDVTRKEDIDKVVNDVLDNWGKIDILVNNAGIARPEWFIDSNGSSWDRIIAVNLKGTILFTHRVLQSMAKHKCGKIINIGSISGKVGEGMQTVYSASKAGVDGFTKALAREVARHQINVNSICPGPVATAMFDQIGKELPGFQEKVIKGVALRRAGRPEEIAAAALFLASDESNFITGHSLVIDGGVTML